LRACCVAPAVFTIAFSSTLRLILLSTRSAAGVALPNVVTFSDFQPRHFCLVAIFKVLELELDYVLQKQNEFNNKIHWYNMLLTVINKFTAGL